MIVSAESLLITYQLSSDTKYDSVCRIPLNYLSISISGGTLSDIIEDTEN